LDEPFAGIDPVTVQSIQGVVQQLRDSGISVLITDHAAREILSVVDRCYVISQGQVLTDGPPEEVKRHPKVREEYLGDLDAAAGGGASELNEADPIVREERPVSVRVDSAHQPELTPAARQAQRLRRRVTDV
ncbi:MAG: LPS export ABC transporter ATP-binding protein, partial [Planctomycetota bacterium]